ncbi:MAG: hypothetical protein Marn2KO_20040 [Marinobacter nauticus]
MGLGLIYSFLDSRTWPTYAIGQAREATAVINWQNPINHVSMKRTLCTKHNGGGLQTVAGKEVVTQLRVMGFAEGQLEGLFMS